MPSARPNIVLLIVDSLRPDHLGIYGYPKDVSPRIDALARQSAVFTQAVAQAPWTLPSVASILTSLYPSEHGAVFPPDDRNWGIKMRDDAIVLRPEQKLDRAIPTLAALLSAAGYRTAGVTANAFCGSIFDIDSGFKDYYECWKRSLRDLNDGTVFPWLERRRQDPFFLYLHAQDVHWPYRHGRPDPGLIARTEKTIFASIENPILEMAAEDVRGLVSAYDASISIFDEEFARLHRKISSLPGGTVFVLTSDHGEGFLEHGFLMHGNSLYDELLLVPLIFSGPGIPAGIRVGSQVRSIDIAPTILDLAGAAKPEAMRGESLLPWMAGTRNDHLPAVSEFSYSRRKFDMSVRFPPWKLLGSREHELLFNVAGDPAERIDRSQSAPDVLDNGRVLVRKWGKTAAGVRRRTRENSDPQDVAALLRAAGYLP